MLEVPLTIVRFAALTALLVAAVPGRAEGTAWEGVGRAPISSGDRVRARERALDEAFGHAIEAAVTSVLGPETLSRRAADLRLKVLPRARSYVTTYRIVDEGEREVGFFSVQVSAGVAIDRLVRELADRGTTTLGAPGPSATPELVLCAATLDGAPLISARFTQALSALVTGRGLAISRPGVGLQRCETEAVLPRVKAAGARAALVVELSPGVASSVRGTSLLGREVKLALRLLEPDGRRSAEGRGDGVGLGASLELATEDAAISALGEATSALDEAFAALGSRGRTGGLSARVLGVRRYAQLASVKAALERLAGVEAVELRRFLPGAPGLVELQLRTAQPLRALLEALAHLASSASLRAHEEAGVLVVEVPEALDPATAGAAQ